MNLENENEILIRNSSIVRIMPKLHDQSGPTILQLNVEGLTGPKCEVIQNIAMNNSVSIILLQETMQWEN